jgi:hypothetical protein
VALLVPEGDSLRVSLSGKEELGALKRSFSIPLGNVSDFAHVSDLWVHLRGIRAPGTGLPGVIMLGTTRYQGKKDFNAVYLHRPGYVLTLTGNAFARVLVTECTGQVAWEKLPVS